MLFWEIYPVCVDDKNDVFWMGFGFSNSGGGGGRIGSKVHGFLAREKPQDVQKDTWTVRKKHQDVQKASWTYHPTCLGVQIILCTVKSSSRQVKTVQRIQSIDILVPRIWYHVPHPSND